MKLLSVTFFLLFFFISCGETTPDPPVKLPKIAISNYSFDEGNENKTVEFKVEMDKTFDKTVSFDVSTMEITAQENVDFVPVNKKFEIIQGKSFINIPVEIIGDDIKEEDEQFSLKLSNCVNCEIIVSEGIGTILNDDTKNDSPLDGYTTPLSYPGYDLLWQDEFDKSSIDDKYWGYDIGASGWGNEEKQYYTDRPDNSYIENGNLVIEARKENYQGAEYTSARMNTKDKFSFMFGRVDIRAVLPEGQGIWPALWMLGDKFSQTGWPSCGEIDIMEMLGHEPNKVYGTAHWGEQGQGFSFHKGDSYTIQGTDDFSDKFHVFTIKWEYNKIQWFVDDNLFYTLSNADVNGSYPFNDNFFFIFNVAVGGKWPGYPDETTVFPQRMIVDYIRVFQKK
ncbi:MAG TPA: glycosyl hydrolase family protein [Bacteroidetes bacterium]|nr:glycosyl hydrolase family protein [Bacteroidota bacterium]